MTTEINEAFEKERKSIALYPHKAINTNEKFYKSLYSIEQILFND